MIERSACELLVDLANGNVSSEALTDAYLEARFGGRALGENTRREFERAIREARALRMPRPT